MDIKMVGHQIELTDILVKVNMAKWKWFGAIGQFTNISRTTRSCICSRNAVIEVMSILANSSMYRMNKYLVVI